MLPAEVAPATILAVLFFLLFFLNYKIFMVARRMRRVDDRVAASLQLNQGNDLPAHIFTLKSRSILKGISTCLFVVMCLFACCFPSFLYNCLGLVSKSLLSPDVDLGLGLWASTLVSMNSTFNCLIFFWKNTTLRNEGRNILRGWRLFPFESNNVEEQNWPLR